MQKVAVFGKPGSGKSTLSKALAKVTGLPYYPLDSIVYCADGKTVDRDVYDAKHNEILASQQWIIDGLGPIGSFYQRLAAADTLVYLDLPYATTYWLATKRLFKGVFITPIGWPEGSNIFKGTFQTFKMLKLSPSFWNSDFDTKLQALSEGKALYVLHSLEEARRLVLEQKEKGLT